MHYLQGLPKGGKSKGTIFLVHGFPDLSYGWRNQFQVLMNLGLRVVAMDSIGYGRTDSPEPLEDYTFKKAADNIKALADQLGVKKIILGGHDWGGATVYRVYQHYPDLVTHIFSIAVPYLPPTEKFVPLNLVTVAVPTLGYQNQMASGIVEQKLTTKNDMRNFINTMYMGRTPDGQGGFSLNKGLDFDRVSRIGKSPLLSSEDLEYYTTEYARHGLKGPCNWYRTSEINFKQDKALKNLNISVPTMHIDTTKSQLIPGDIMKSSKSHIPNLTSRGVYTDHWAMLENPEAVNVHIKQWIEQVVFGGKPNI